MSGFFTVLLGITMVAVLVTLLVGVGAMTKDGDFNKKYGNKLMRLRVILQGLALLFFALAVATR